MIILNGIFFNEGVISNSEKEKIMNIDFDIYILDLFLSILMFFYLIKLILNFRIISFLS
jgi:hypothetical protein